VTELALEELSGRLSTPLAPLEVTGVMGCWGEEELDTEACRGDDEKGEVCKVGWKKDLLPLFINLEAVIAIPGSMTGLGVKLASLSLLLLFSDEAACLPSGSPRFFT
jgi:hypothetical protein